MNNIKTNLEIVVSPFRNILGEEGYKDYMVLLTNGMYVKKGDKRSLSDVEYGRLKSYIEVIKTFVKKFYTETREAKVIGEYLTGIDTSTNKQLPLLRKKDWDNFHEHLETLRLNQEGDKKYIPDYQI